MTTVFGELDHVLLMAPGPSPVAPNVLKAMSIPTLGHLDPDCIKVMDAMQEQLRAVCKTRNAVTFPISGTGSAGMEATFVNLVERGDDVLIVNNGVFCSRMVEVATRLGARVDVVECPWGRPIDPAAVKARWTRNITRFWPPCMPKPPPASTTPSPPSANWSRTATPSIW